MMQKRLCTLTYILKRAVVAILIIWLDSGVYW
jgi:hypothetical protein